MNSSISGTSLPEAGKIALDIMSGDESPRSRIRAALRVLQNTTDLHLALVGDESLITSFLQDHHYDPDRLQVVHAEKTISMHEKPSQALRKKKGSSMWLALDLVSQGQAGACVSAGNTGALMAMGRFALKTFAGIDRPAIAASLPCRNGSTLLLDMGANVDCTSRHLYQFAVMGAQLAASIKGVDSPRVGLLNVGTEEVKGNEQVRLAHQLLQDDRRLNYIGYIEGHDIFTDRADVIVCDGFAGNIALKTGEGVANLIRDGIIAAFQKTVWSRILLALASPALKGFFRRIDPVLHNGASFLGLQGIVVKSHGGADEEGFYRAIMQAACELEADVPGRLSADVEAMMMGEYD